MKYINDAIFKSFKCQPHKMVKHTHTIRWQFADDLFSVFDHFMSMALKRFKKIQHSISDTSISQPPFYKYLQVSNNPKPLNKNLTNDNIFCSKNAIS